MKRKIITLVFILIVGVGCSSSGKLQKSPCACNDQHLTKEIKHNA